MPQEPPAIERVSKDVLAYDRPAEKWRPGERQDIMVIQEIITVTWTNTGVGTDIPPDHDYEIDTTFARRIIIQLDSMHPSNTSTDFDVNVMAAVDGQAWDTVPFVERNIGDGERKTFLVEPAPQKLRFRGDQNAAAKTGYITARVMVVK